jgi:hypothetical protein
MSTGARASTHDFYMLVRRMGASAREMLASAAAARLAVLKQRPSAKMARRWKRRAQPTSPSIFTGFSWNPPPMNAKAYISRSTLAECKKPKSDFNSLDIAPIDFAGDEVVQGRDQC